MYKYLSICVLYIRPGNWYIAGTQESMLANCIWKKNIEGEIAFGGLGINFAYSYVLLNLHDGFIFCILMGLFAFRSLD